ncbi:uncharacterized protein BDZ99DRAFT_93668 [Mytilinidion resinicola]|uniref:Uncharacterized protein n=1 Tax=Mytilinidion resinicola TaxID=574789 RepID=A0A6A6YC94_9PEZI|nr:uncharacterized protein BDZ99DRAFT_93668 [Mytilinidion resinicola]KAF2806330.1 hypothetical protein BDZ99DRAFT_93668 [Mytilinidion resinicola]
MCAVAMGTRDPLSVTFGVISAHKRSTVGCFMRLSSVTSSLSLGTPESINSKFVGGPVPALPEGHNRLRGLDHRREAPHALLQLRAPGHAEDEVLYSARVPGSGTVSSLSPSSRGILCTASSLTYDSSAPEIYAGSVTSDLVGGCSKIIKSCRASNKWRCIHLRALYITTSVLRAAFSPLLNRASLSSNLLSKSW